MNPRTARIGRSMAFPFRKRAPCSTEETTTWRSSMTPIPTTRIGVIAIGSIEKGLVLVVYTERDEETVRLISARWATKREADLYRRHVQGGAL